MYTVCLYYTCNSWLRAGQLNSKLIFHSLLYQDKDDDRSIAKVGNSTHRQMLPKLRYAGTRVRIDGTALIDYPSTKKEK